MSNEAMANYITDTPSDIAELLAENKSLESQLTEARELVKGLVGVLVFYAKDNVYLAGGNIEPQGTWRPSPISVDLGCKARQCLKDNAEAIERLTKEEK